MAVKSRYICGNLCYIQMFLSSLVSLHIFDLCILRVTDCVCMRARVCECVCVLERARLRVYDCVRVCARVWLCVIWHICVINIVLILALFLHKTHESDYPLSSIYYLENDDDIIRECSFYWWQKILCISS